MYNVVLVITILALIVGCGLTVYLELTENKFRQM